MRASCRRAADCETSSCTQVTGCAGGKSDRPVCMCLQKLDRDVEVRRGAEVNDRRGKCLLEETADGASVDDTC